AIERGRREISGRLEQLDDLLTHELFKDLGPLTRFPADNQVLQRREGYRDIFRAYLEFEVAAALSWNHSDDRFFAGQRVVATLYEYWAFVQLATLVAELAGESFDIASLVEAGRDGLNVALKCGKEKVLCGTIERRGRILNLELWYNKTFIQGHPLGSWTRPM